MTTLTDKELIKEIKERISSLDVRDNIERRAYEIALASLEAEPVAVNDDMAYAFHHALSDSSLGADEVEEIKAGLRAAFANVTTQPAPVVPEFETWFNSQESGRSICSTQIRRSLQEISWNACCAAMLQCVEPASNHEEFPLDYLQGQKDGLEWAAQLAEANHPQTGDWLYDDPLELAKAIRKGPDMPEFDGPTPGTPDGWISCSERIPPQDDWILIYSKHGEYMAGQVQGEYVELSDGTLSWLGNALFWMPLPEPPEQDGE